MKTILIALNSSYVHTNLAVRSLAGMLPKDVAVFEYNINQHDHDVFQDILRQHAEVVAFSCYIWNISYIMRLAEDIKAAAPETKIILGGPEASFRAEELLDKDYIDYVVCGEAEVCFDDFLKELKAKKEVKTQGVIYRKNGNLAGDGTYQVVADLSKLPPPFSEKEEYDEHRIYYYESSRGCPFSCAYCLSGIGNACVREKSIKQVQRELDEFVSRKVKLVKFTDRTFNANKSRAKEIIRYVLKNTGKTAFHFEVALDLMDQEMIQLLNSAPIGKIQLEAGVQTTNPKTLTAVIRKTNIALLKKNALSILKAGNIHLHLDLIAGLPYESMERFQASFNEVYVLYPDALQLGFLKLLQGTKLREEAQEYGIRFRSYPPYEVIRTNDIAAEELLYLKGIEGLLSRYYNKGRARIAFDYLTKSNIFAPFALYESLYEFCGENGYLDRPVSARDQFVLLIEFAKQRLDEAQQKTFYSLLRRDYDRIKIKGIIPKQLTE